MKTISLTDLEGLTNEIQNFIALTVTSDTLIKNHVQPFANIEIDSKLEWAIVDILHEFEKKFNSLECDPEGPTLEQDKALDTILNDCASAILLLVNAVFSLSEGDLTKFILPALKIDKTEAKIEKYSSGYYAIMAYGHTVYGGDSACKDHYDEASIKEIYENWDGIVEWDNSNNYFYTAVL